MAIRNSVPIRWTPRGLSDAGDGTNSFQGAEKTLQNVIPDPSTAGAWVPRPASIQKTNFTGTNAPAGAGVISGRLIVGDTEYGMVPSNLNPGKDEPYVYDLSADTFTAVSGITGGNVPTSPPTSGDWVPPILCQIAGRVIVTHPGFPGAAVKFGWFDVSGFSQLSTLGDLRNGRSTIFGNFPIIGVQPGMTIVDGGGAIPAGTTVLYTSPYITVLNFTTTSGSPVLTSAVTNNVFVGMDAAGAGIPAGATVLSVVDSVSVTISANATASATVPVTFTGTQIEMSANATADDDSASITIAGGTLTAPLWGAGDVDNQRELGNVGLASVPLGVAQMNGRAYFADGLDGIPFSDSGFPCRMSNTLAVQVLTTNDGLSVTAIAPLLLGAPITGGVVQALIAFEGEAKMQQITGDQATGNLSMNVLPVATGTLAPLSIVPCGGQLGTAFISPLGLRFVRLDGTVSDPVGADGQGKTQPFQFAVAPSQICAAANAAVYRVTVQNGMVEGAPYEEYWYDLTRRMWNGPHTFPSRLIQPWRSTFVLAPIGIPASLWRGDSYASSISIYIENGNQLSWIMETVLLPDNAQMAMNAMVEATLDCAATSDDQLVISALDENGAVLDTVAIVTSATNQSLRQRSLDWTEPVIFKQMSIRVSGPSDDTVRIGNHYMRYEILGYNLDDIGDDNFLLAEDGVTILSDNTVPPILLTPG